MVTFWIFALKVREVLFCACERLRPIAVPLLHKLHVLAMGYTITLASTF